MFSVFVFSSGMRHAGQRVIKKQIHFWILKPISSCMSISYSELFGDRCAWRLLWLVLLTASTARKTPLWANCNICLKRSQNWLHCCFGRPFLSSQWTQREWEKSILNRFCLFQFSDFFFLIPLSETQPSVMSQRALTLLSVTTPIARCLLRPCEIIMFLPPSNRTGHTVFILFFDKLSFHSVTVVFPPP